MMHTSDSQCRFIHQICVQFECVAIRAKCLSHFSTTGMCARVVETMRCSLHLNTQAHGNKHLGQLLSGHKYTQTNHEKKKQKTRIAWMKICWINFVLSCAKLSWAPVNQVLSREMSQFLSSSTLKLYAWMGQQIQNDTHTHTHTIGPYGRWH